jgi:hypothetical protein
MSLLLHQIRGLVTMNRCVISEYCQQMRQI